MSEYSSLRSQIHGRLEADLKIPLEDNQEIAGAGRVDALSSGPEWKWVLTRVYNLS